MAEQRLSTADVTAVLHEYWWDLVRYRLAQLGKSDLGLNTVEMLFLSNEEEAVDSTHRDMRDQDRDVRGDRVMH